MKKLLLLIINFCLLAISCYAQNVSELDRRNGFKSIKLGLSIDSVKGAVFKKEILERNEFKASVYQTEFPEYMTVGDVPVKKLLIHTYNGLIYEIHIYLPKDSRIMSGLEKSFGASTHSLKMNAYYWKTENMSLIYEGEGKQIHLTYRSALMIKKMYADKNSKAQAIAEDF